VKPVRIVYKNWKGVVSERQIVPERIWYGVTEWHPRPQWLLRAHDIAKGEARDFAMSDIQSWEE